MEEKTEPSIKTGVDRLLDGWQKTLVKLEARGVKKVETYLIVGCALTFLFSIKYGLIFIGTLVAYYIFALSKERNKHGNNPNS